MDHHMAGHDHSAHIASMSTAPPMHDHAMHDHDPTTTMSHDHTGSGDMMGHGHMMMMYFHGGYEETILFEDWKINSLGGLIGSMIGIFVMAALYEGLKYYREYLFWKTYHNMQYRAVSIPGEKTPEDNARIGMVGEVMHKRPRPTMLSVPHIFQTGMHIVQIVLSYFLMLIFMTYNTWLCIAVVAGAAVGYFLFGWKKTVIVDVTEHCH